MTVHCLDGDQMCRCGYLKRNHALANFADGPHVGAAVLICPAFIFREHVLEGAALPAQAPQETYRETLLVIDEAMSALESDATDEERQAAWNALRDRFYPESGISNTNSSIAAPAPREESVENIPEFVEPRYWIERTTHGWGVFYRQENRKLCVHGTMNSTEAVARNCAKALNDVLYEEVTAYRAGPAPAPNPELLTALKCLLAVIAAGDLIPESVSYMKYARAAVANAAAPAPRGPQEPE